MLIMLFLSFLLFICFSCLVFLTLKHIHFFTILQPSKTPATGSWQIMRHVESKLLTPEDIQVAHRIISRQRTNKWKSIEKPGKILNVVSNVIFNTPRGIYFLCKLYGVNKLVCYLIFGQKLHLVLNGGSVTLPVSEQSVSPFIPTPTPLPHTHTLPIHCSMTALLYVVYRM